MFKESPDTLYFFVSPGPGPEQHSLIHSHTEYLLWARPLLNKLYLTHANPGKWAELLSPFYRWGNGGSEVCDPPGSHILKRSQPPRAIPTLLQGCLGLAFLMSDSHPGLSVVGAAGPEAAAPACSPHPPCPLSISPLCPLLPGLGRLSHHIPPSVLFILTLAGGPDLV